MPKKVATKSPGFNIIEEYTLDEANITADATHDKSQPDNQNLQPGNVGTSSLDREPTTSTVVKVETLSALKTDTNLSKADIHYTSTGNDKTSSPLQCVETGSETKPQVCVQSPTSEETNIEFELSNNQPQSALHVATESEKSSTGLNPAECPDEIINAGNSTTGMKKQLTVKQPVTCPEDSLVLLQYPWKCELKVKLDRIQPLEINIWSKNVHDYHVFTAPIEVTLIISEVKGYGLCARPIKAEAPADDLNDDKTDQLIDQAQALINTAKTFVTKPVNRKQPRK